MKGLLLLMSLILLLPSYGQYEDDFEDETLGDTPNNFSPSLSGDAGNFILVDEGGDKQLRTNTGQLGTSQDYYLSIPSTQITNTTWEFYINLKFNPSGVNYVDVFLVSDVSDLTAAQNGYFVRIGDSEDWIAFHKIVSGTESGPLINTAEDILNNSSSKPYKIRVTRDVIGNWEMFIDEDVTGTFVSVGTILDSDVTSSFSFGFLVQQSTAASPANQHFFDDFFVGNTPTDTDPPTIQSITAISATEVDVQFNEDVDPTTAQNTSNYVMDGSISVNNATLDADNSLVHLTTSTMTNSQTYTVTINNVEDINGNVIAADSEDSFQYLVFEEADEFDVVINEFMPDPNPVVTSLPDAEYVELYNRSNKFLNLENWTLDGQTLPAHTLAPNAYVLVVEDDDIGLFVAFSEVIDITTLSLNNSSSDNIILADDNATTIHSISFEGSTGGISTELINPNGPDYSDSNYGLSIDPDGGTPGEQNSIFDDTPDTTPPTIESVTVVSTMQLDVVFSEVLEETSAETSANYTIDGGIDVISATLDGSLQLVSLVVDPIPSGEIRTLTVTGIEDLSGNSQEVSITFGIGRSPAFNELIITEVMFDPDPQVELPDLEFIEVFNATAEIISTENVNLTDASSTVELPVRTLSPGEYYVLTTTSGAAEFGMNAIGVSSFPSLNNSGEQLILSLNDELIFSLNYDPDWHEEDKADGGYSLEMRDVSNPCLENEINWGSSQDAGGGTPGAANSVSEVIPDNFGPELILAVAITSDSLLVEFNEKVNPSNVQTVSATLTPSIAIDEIYFDLNFPSSIFISLGSELEESIPYTLSVENLTDCSGNEIQSGDIEFALPVQAETEDIKLSEVLFNPRSNGVDFVEVYNDSEKYISLKNWKLGNFDDEGNIDDIDVITTEELVINPNAYLVFTTDANVLLTNYPTGVAANFVEIPAMPTYANDEGTVLLIDQSQVVVEIFSYNEDLHYDLLESVDGVSLERVSFEESTNNGDNWRSASSTEGFATPGYANSQSFENNQPVGKVTASPEVFIPGNAGSGRDFTTINYQVDQPGKFANVNIYDQTGRLVKNLAQGVLLSTSGFLRWDGDTNSGGMARMGYHLIIFEIYDSSGNSEIIKETVVVGRDF